MDISQVIGQLRTYVPALKLVGGAAEFNNCLETTVNPSGLPAAYVIPLAEDAEDNELENGLRQTVRERIGVILEISNTADRRGQKSVSEVDDLKYAVFVALLNWRIDPIRAQKGLQYAGGRLIDMDRARLWWQFDFDLTTIILDEDGFQPPSTILEDIRVDIVLDDTPSPPPAPEPVEVDIFLHPPNP